MTQYPIPTVNGALDPTGAGSAQAGQPRPVGHLPNGETQAQKMQRLLGMIGEFLKMNSPQSPLQVSQASQASQHPTPNGQPGGIRVPDQAPEAYSGNDGWPRMPENEFSGTSNSAPPAFVHTPDSGGTHAAGQYPSQSGKPADTSSFNNAMTSVLSGSAPPGPSPFNKTQPARKRPLSNRLLGRY